eukprot:TRINITY_DN12326_c0_g1_i1.p1 TRINITY_DN12326_c0_g1~~TRINITY_DN12326_c0_g1_i1.p1  ORF type:complete len:496 (+),score=92.38 TRINITY_DN12326_c0_g1_i1:77-1564(+)
MFIANHKLLSYSARTFNYFQSMATSFFGNSHLSNNSTTDEEDPQSPRTSSSSSSSSTSSRSLKDKPRDPIGSRDGSEPDRPKLSTLRLAASADKQLISEKLYASLIEKIKGTPEETEQAIEKFEQKLLPSVIPWSSLSLFTNDAFAKLSLTLKEASLTRNQIEGRISSLQYSANSPIEDRYFTAQLSSIEGYLFGVFDGHGGFAVADFAKTHVCEELDNILAKHQSEAEYDKNDPDKLIITSLNEAFDKVEDKYLEIVRKSYKSGDIGASRVGSCALVGVVHGNKVYVANIGDSKGILLREQPTKDFQCLKLNKRFSAVSKKEQARLKASFPEDPEILVCKPYSPKACYVKNRLQPTRAFGDFYLKLAEFNDPEKNNDLRNIRDFHGPYITHRPEVRVIELRTEDKFLVLASDGLWDELTNSNVAEVVEAHRYNKDDISHELLYRALEHAALTHGMDLEELEKLPPGMRRRTHDDITIIVVDLQNQVTVDMTQQK